MESKEWRALSAGVKRRIAAFQERAPVSMSGIAKELDVRVVASTLPVGISGELRPEGGRYVIRVNRHDTPARQRFTVAHELAHFLLHKDHIGSGISDDALYRSGLSDWRESEANRLAADLLMPAALVSGVARDLLGKHPPDTLPGLMSDIFNVSEAAMRIRLEQLQGG